MNVKLFSGNSEDHLKADSSRLSRTSKKQGLKILNVHHPEFEMRKLNIKIYPGA